MAEFLMPSLGADMTDGTIVEWRKQPGERIERGDILVDVETEKGIIEVEVFTAGVVERLLVEPGTKVAVGAPIAVIGAVADSEAEADSGAGADSDSDSDSEAGTVSEPEPETESGRAGISISGSELARRGSVRATPSARRLARDAGIDASALTGTGSHGTIIREDVEQAVERRAAAPSPPVVRPATPRVQSSPLARRRAKALGLDIGVIEPTSPDGVVHISDVEREATRPRRAAATDKRPAMRHAIATAMSRAKREIPHYYLSTTVDLGPAMRWLAAENAQRSVPDRLIPGVLFLKATALALREVPELNAHWRGDDAPRLDRIHVGVAISLRQGGLIAPAIHDTDTVPLDALMHAFKDLVTRARAGAVRSSEMADATITVTSLGERGVDTVFPIINPPQVAMVGFGRIAERPWSVDGQVVSRPVVAATLAADHRVSDGHKGGLYLAAIERLLSTPEKL